MKQCFKWFPWLCFSFNRGQPRSLRKPHFMFSCDDVDEKGREFETADRIGVGLEKQAKDL